MYGLEGRTWTKSSILAAPQHTSWVESRARWHPCPLGAANWTQGMIAPSIDHPPGVAFEPPPLGLLLPLPSAGGLVAQGRVVPSRERARLRRRRRGPSVDALGHCGWPHGWRREGKDLGARAADARQHRLRRRRQATPRRLFLPPLLVLPAPPGPVRDQHFSRICLTAFSHTNKATYSARGHALS